MYVVASLGLTGCATSDFDDSGLQHERKEFLFSPYLDINIPVHAGVPTAMTSFLEGLKALIGLPATAFPDGIKTLTLAFATGECGAEHWDELDAQRMTETHIKRLRRENIDYVISTGGAEGVFTCASEAGMEKFIARYNSRHLVGFDFDIESNQSEVMINNLVHQIRGAMQRHPHLRFSFTLATQSSSVPEQASLNEHGTSVMKAIERARLENFFINLMVMNFGDAKPDRCVVESGRCAMAASAIQVVSNFILEYGVPLKRIEVTPMIGVNDVVDNVFTLEDAQALSRYVVDNGLGGLHFWSLNRDGPCAPGSLALSPVCNGLTNIGRLTFINAFAKSIR